MDIYLPVDFHELHDSAADDWRDMSSSRATRDHLDTAQARRADEPECCAEQDWHVI